MQRRNVEQIVLLTQQHRDVACLFS